jgi:hypothetical protein
MSDDMDVSRVVYHDDESGCGLPASVPAVGESPSGREAHVDPMRGFEEDPLPDREHPRPNARRAPLDNVSNATFSTSTTRSTKVPACQAAVPDETDGSLPSPPPPPTAAELKERAVAMFVDRRSDVSGSGLDAFAGEATYALVLHAQQAVHELWEQRRADICGSPARPDLQLDKEEGLGYLLGDVLRGELLPDEARAIGKRAGKLATKAKGELESAKSKAKAKRSKVRAAAAKDAALAAGLDAAIGTIDAAASSARDAILAAVCDLGLPPANTVVRERAAPKPPATDVLSRLRAVVEKADAAVARAEADAAAAKRRAERVAAQLDKLHTKRLLQSKSWHLSEEGYQVHLQETAETDAEYAQVRARSAELRCASVNAEFAAWDARDAAKDAREAVADEEAARSQQAACERAARERKAEWDAEWGAKFEELRREREADMAAAAERDARLAELKSQLAALHCEPLQEQVRWEMPAETRDRLHAGAELVWGSVQGSQAAAAPKVFKLTGMSASEVRELTSQVSQESTGVEETVALNRSGLS